jgi:hypothetical protein
MIGGNILRQLLHLRQAGEIGLIGFDFSTAFQIGKFHLHPVELVHIAAMYQKRVTLGRELSCRFETAAICGACDENCLGHHFFHFL